MLVRTLSMMSVLVGFLFAAVGAVTLAAVITWTLPSVMIGCAVWQTAAHAPADRLVIDPGRSCAKTGVVAGVAFLVLRLAVDGFASVFGAEVAAYVVLLCLSVLAGAAWRVWSGPASASAPPAAKPVPVPILSCPAPAADLPTDELCVAWRRSYLNLQQTADGEVRREIIRLRRDYLDEIERRDRPGFARWLDSGARAGSDPRRFLSTEE
ncbi:hypothetical protein GCM10009754_41830 [Amycolatopsis minnesotensis]|uniref:Uncharacterized protein n=2 Tax=Amycolatopsis minnesotensis TaxID=337894 RepID=A0ABN2R9Y4_9PSEU